MEKYLLYRYLKLMNKKSTPGGNNGVSGVSKRLLVKYINGFNRF